MNYKFFLQGIKNIIINPEKIWEPVISETSHEILIRKNFFIPLAILVSLSSIAGSLIFRNTELSPLYSVLIGIKSFVLIMFTVYATSYILGEITFPLDLGKDFNTSFRLIVYSFTPFLLCEIVSSLFESLLFINIIGLYGLYIFWIGTEKLLTPPQYKKMPLLIAATISLSVIYIVTNLVLSNLTDRIYFALFA